MHVYTKKQEESGHISYRRDILNLTELPESDRGKVTAYFCQLPAFFLQFISGKDEGKTNAKRLRRTI